MFTENDLNYIELFLASDIKLVRYQVKGMSNDQIHNLIHQMLKGMIFKLTTFLDKSKSKHSINTSDESSDKE